MGKQWRGKKQGTSDLIWEMGKRGALIREGEENKHKRRRMEGKIAIKMSGRVKESYY